MAEVNKEELRRLGEAASKVSPDLHYLKAYEAYKKAFVPSTVLSLLDENAAQAARIAELERDKVRLESEAMYGAAGFQAAKERIVELERECERLRESKQKWKSFAELANVERQSLFAELEACRKDAERLRGKLLEASQCIAEWGAYASEYFQEKYHLERDIAEFKDAAMQEGGV